MPSRQDDEVAWRSRGAARRGSAGRSVALGVGLVLAVAATAGAFLTDEARYLRLAVLAAAWAFVAAALVVGRMRSEQHAAAGREQELRRAYEHELDLEAAARREFELELGNDLRRQAEEAMRRELAALRRDLAELARVREELARTADLRAGLASLADVRADLAGISALREDVAALSALRNDVAALAGLRGEVAALSARRSDLDQVGELRAELARLRTELAELLGGEMLVERVVMRAQASRLFAGEEQALPGRAEPEPRPAAPRTAAFPLTTHQPPPPAGEPPARVRTPVEWLADRALLDPEEPPVHARSRHASAEPSLAGPSRDPSPSPDPSEQATAETTAERPVPYRRRRTDDTGAQRPVDPEQALTTEHRAAAAVPPIRPPVPVSPQRTTAPGGHVRVAEILAENGISPTGTPRRRRHYREDDEPDDVLARVLGRS